MRRIDHAMILVMIAGSYTPYAINLMPVTLGAAHLAVWGLAALGAVLAVHWPRALQRWRSALYLGTGWLIVPLYEPDFGGLLPAVLMLPDRRRRRVLGGIVIFHRPPRLSANR